METIATEELRRNLRDILDNVQAGGVYRVERYGKSVAVILSVDEYERLQQYIGNLERMIESRDARIVELEDE